MAVSLYRKYRPARFEDIIGQDHVARTLVNAIQNDRLSHAYLFAGPRGTGKTSTAKILAMALNCQAGGDSATPTPDGTCANCEAIRRGTSMDVVEMDAASNRGIDDIRELRDKVHFAPVEGRMKVYIVDEVHMLTPEAFNALLKTLEEPPPHATFVLATTEPHKVPATILSRCQRFDFRRPNISEVVEVLADVARQEGIKAEQEAMLVVARAAGGSFRDALGILDQLSTYSGGAVKLQETLDVLGVVRHDLLFEAVDLFSRNDTEGALMFVERLSQDGTDYAQFIKDLLGHLRDVYVVGHTSEPPANIAATEEQLQRLRSQASSAPSDRVVSFLDLLGEALRSIRQGADPRLELELALIKVTTDGRPAGSPAASPAPTPAPAPAPTTGPTTPQSSKPPKGEPPKTEPPVKQESPKTAPPAKQEHKTDAKLAQKTDQATAGDANKSDSAETPSGAAPKVPADLDHLKRAWPVILEAVKKRQAGLSVVLGEGRPQDLKDDRLIVEFPAGCGFQADQVARGGNPKVIAEALREVTGKALSVDTALAAGAAEAAEVPEEDARISQDELIRELQREFDAQMLDDEAHR